MQQMVTGRWRRGRNGEMLPSGDSKVDATKSLFKLLESKDAFVPTRGRDKEAGSPTGRQKGVRT